MKFQDRLKSLIDRIEGGMPKEYVEIMHHSTKALKDSGIESRVMQVGDILPEFSLVAPEGAAVSSQAFLSKGPLVLTFYRGFWCPYCNEDLANLNKYVQEIRGLGAELVAVSPELPEYSQKIMDQRRLDYSILHDPSNQLADKIGLKWYMDAPVKELYHDKFNINLAQYHGDTEWSLPMPARILVDREGTIRYIETDADYRKRPDPDALIAVLKSL